MTAAQLDALIATVESWEPGYAASIEGVEASKLDELEQALGTELLPEHRAFLAKMGGDNGGINAYGDEVIDLRYAALREFVEAKHGFDPRAFMILGVPAQFDVPLLMFDRRGGATPAPLIRLGFGDGTTPAISAEHSSLMAMLITFAFIRKRVGRMPWELHLESPGRQRPRFPDCPPGRWLPRFAWIARQLGLELLPGVEPWAVCAQSPGPEPAVCAMMYECPGYSPDVRVGARERTDLLRTVEQLADNLELRTRANSLRSP